VPHRRRRPFTAGLALASIIGCLLAVGHPPGADGATPALRVTTYCYEKPEKTVIRNNRSTSVTIRTVGSIYKPRTNEPFVKTRTLRGGSTVTFYSGFAATAGASTTLTRQYIYQDDVGTAEGARVTSSAGTFTDRC
jgi:hypothetical protein